MGSFSFCPILICITRSSQQLLLYKLNCFKWLEALVCSAIYVGVWTLNIYWKIHYLAIKYSFVQGNELDELDLYLFCGNCLRIGNVCFLKGAAWGQLFLHSWFFSAWCLYFRHPFPSIGWLPVLWRLTLLSICLRFVYKPYSLRQLPSAPPQSHTQRTDLRCSSISVIVFVTRRCLVLFCLFKWSLWPER